MVPTPDDGKPVLKGVEIVIAGEAKENPKVKTVAVQQIVDLRYVP